MTACPPIPAHLGLDDLGRQVLRGAAQRPRAVRDPLREPEVCDLEVAVPAGEDQSVTSIRGLLGGRALPNLSK